MARMWQCVMYWWRSPLVMKYLYHGAGDRMVILWSENWRGSDVLLWSEPQRRKKRCQHELIVTSYYGGVYNVQTNPKKDVVARSLKRHNFDVRFLTSKNLSKSTMTWQFYDVRIRRQYDVISTLMCPLENYFYYSLNQILQPKIAYCTHGLHDAILFVRWSWCLNFFSRFRWRQRKLGVPLSPPIWKNVNLFVETKRDLCWRW